MRQPHVNRFGMREVVTQLCGVDTINEHAADRGYVTVVFIVRIRCVSHTNWVPVVQENVLHECWEIGMAF